MIRVTREKVNVKCILTDEEKLKYGQEVSRALVDRAQAEADMKSFSAEKKAEIAGFDARIGGISGKINNGYEYRDIDCDVHYDWIAKEKRWINRETGEIVKDDIISEKDLQEHLDFEDKEKRKAEDKAAQDRAEKEKIKGAVKEAIDESKAEEPAAEPQPEEEAK
jgi:hypothetical protein